MDILKYKDYEGTAELDMTRGICRGKVLFITDLVTYESALPSQLQSEFEAAVDDYLATCEELQREPKKPLKGQFNVRISPELHRNATLRAIRDTTSLNEVVVRALDAYLNGQDVKHVETKNYFFPAENMREIFATTSTPAAHQVIVGGAAMGAFTLMAGTGGRQNVGAKH